MALSRLGLIQYSVISSCLTILLLILFGWQIRMWHPIVRKKMAPKNTFCSRLITYKEYQKLNSLLIVYDFILSTRFRMLCILIGKRALVSNHVDMRGIPEWGLDNFMHTIVQNVVSKYVKDTTMPLGDKVTYYDLVFWNSQHEYPERLNGQGVVTLLFRLGGEQKATKSLLIKEGTTCIQLSLDVGDVAVLPSSWTHEIVNLPTPVPDYFLVCNIGAKK